MPVNWEISQAPDAFKTAFDQASKSREIQQQEDARNALAAYVSNPGGDMGAAIKQGADPGTVFAAQQNRQAQAAAQKQAALEQQKTLNEKLPLQIRMLEGLKVNPALAPQMFQQAQRLGLDVPPDGQATPEWIDEQLAILKPLTKEGGLDLLTNTAKEVMLTLPPENRNVDDPLFRRTLAQAMQKTQSVQAGGSIIGYGPGQDAHFIVGGPPNTQAPAQSVGDLYPNYPVVKNYDSSRWGARTDGSAKGPGWLGVRQRPDGRVSSEISVGIEMDGKNIEIPLMVPGLTPQEMDYLMTKDVDPRNIPRSIMDKAVSHAIYRQKNGLSPFAGPNDTPEYP